jgi:thiol:disulfide interchange protein DsbC
MNRSTNIFVLAALFLPANLVFAEQSRWYSAEQVTHGMDLFAANCAACHGQRGEATPDWRKPDDQGKYPAPPLNGTAHTWHHSMDVLRRTVKQGGGKVGGSMPAFGSVLKPEDINAVLAYVQSLWPEEIYTTWAKANPDDAAAELLPVTSGNVDENGITGRLAKLLPPQTTISDPQATPVSGVYEVKAGSQFIYIDSTGQYGFVGNLIDLATGESLTEAKRTIERAAEIASFPIDDKIVFAANGEQRAYIDVFTDTTCPYCRKLHAEVPQLQAAGITVRYLAFPRGGQNSQGDRELRAVWCAADPVQGMHLAKTQTVIPDNDGNCEAASAVTAGYQLGVALGVRGTPAIVLPDGTMIPGYRPHGELLATLGVEKVRQ